MAEPVQVRYTLRLRDQRSMWMQDGCQVYMDSNTASNGSCLMVTWTIFKNHLLEVGLNHDTPNAHDCWFLLFYHVWGPASIDMHWNSIRLRVRSHMISHYNRGSVTTPTWWFGRCVGMALGRLLLGSHNFTVTALGSCAKWPSIPKESHWFVIILRSRISIYDQCLK